MLRLKVEDLNILQPLMILKVKKVKKWNNLKKKAPKSHQGLEVSERINPNLKMMNSKVKNQKYLKVEVRDLLIEINLNKNH